MLIAIMSNTYDMVSEKKNASMMRERISILSEYRAILSMFSPNHRYFFIVKPTNENLSGAQEWEGRISAIKNEIKKSVNALSMDME